MVLNIVLVAYAIYILLGILLEKLLFFAIRFYGRVKNEN
jgi:hypothetical protein